MFGVEGFERGGSCCYLDWFIAPATQRLAERPANHLFVVDNQNLLLNVFQVGFLHFLAVLFDGMDLTTDSLIIEGRVISHKTASPVALVQPLCPRAHA